MKENEKRMTSGEISGLSIANIPRGLSAALASDVDAMNNLIFFAFICIFFSFVISRE